MGLSLAQTIHEKANFCLPTFVVIWSVVGKIFERAVTVVVSSHLNLRRVALKCLSIKTLKTINFSICLKWKINGFSILFYPLTLEGRWGTTD